MPIPTGVPLIPENIAKLQSAGLITPDEAQLMTAVHADPSPAGIAEAVLSYHGIEHEEMHARAQVAELMAAAVRIAQAQPRTTNYHA